MQATGLLPILLGVAAGRARVSGHGFGAEEAERVEAAAPQRTGDLSLDHGVGARGAQPQRNTVVTDSATAVDHRPLVQSETVQLGRPPPGGAQQTRHECDGVQPAAQVCIVDRGPGRRNGVAAAAAVSTDRFAAGEQHPVTRVPAAQLPGTQAVIAEQEVPHRMRLTGLRPLDVGGDEHLDAHRVVVRARGPLLGVQGDGGSMARARHAASRRARRRPDRVPNRPAPPSPPRLRRDR